MDNEPNGTYLIELAVPFGLLINNGYDIASVSPKGGSIPVYHAGETSQAAQSIVDSIRYQSETKNSLSPSQIKAHEYSAIVIPGGYGQFWHTHGDQGIQHTIAAVYEASGVFGTISHGTATLVNVKLRSGEYLVAGSTLTRFPSWNEKKVIAQSNYGELQSFDMGTELLNRGANLQVYDHEKRTYYEIVDKENRLVTTSFAGSEEFLAEEITRLVEL